jgi:hypothetical protein
MVPNEADEMRKPCNLLVPAAHFPAAHLAALRLERRRDPATRRINSTDIADVLVLAAIVEMLTLAAGAQMRGCFLNRPAGHIGGVIANTVESR